MKPFDMLTAPLEGVNLIEASAGTGKTFTIISLFLRLLLEKELTVDQILVVTFTQAATQEIRDRVRNKLNEAYNYCITGANTKDKTLEQLIKRAIDKSSSAYVRKQLLMALRNIDDAAIYTIHGFSQRMLRENAFESSNLFNTELVADISEFSRQVIEDYWRCNLYESGQLFASYVLKKMSLDSLVQMIGKFGSNSLASFSPPAPTSIPDYSLLEDSLGKAYSKIVDNWTKNRDIIVDFLLNSPLLKRNIYKESSMPALVSSMDAFISSSVQTPCLFEKFELFGKNKLEASIKKGEQVPDIKFFAFCQEYYELSGALAGQYDLKLLALKHKLFKYYSSEFKKLKEEKNIQCFDDLIDNLFAALNSGTGDELANNIRSKFKAALIDEFQDTDPKQYFIFNKIFNLNDSILFLIGDPKQAIYGFRGADIFAYMKAAEQSPNKYTLVKNYRSHYNMIKAINCVFSKAHEPFVFSDDIIFNPVEAANDIEDNSFFCKNHDSALHIWYLNKENSSIQLNATKARDLITRKTALEISNLISQGRRSEVLVNGKSVQEGDIAVLVPTNEQAIIIKNALTEIGVQSVLYNSGNLFETEEAFDMVYLLYGIVHHDKIAAVISALSTSFIGKTGEEISVLLEDEEKFEEFQVRFREYYAIWSTAGFIKMFNHVIMNEGIMSRLMRYRNGERRNTNLLHLSEVLHQATLGKNLSPSGLIKWLNEQVSDGSSRTEETQLRLESDAKSVKIITIHKSKGLEFPIVFLPFSWSGDRSIHNDEPFPFHDPNNGRNLCIDLGSGSRDINLNYYKREMLAEKVRLLYVAMTRAKYRCYIAIYPSENYLKSAMAYIFHHPLIDRKMKELNDDDFFNQLCELSKVSEGTIKSEYVTNTETLIDPKQPEFEGDLLSCRKFNSVIESAYRITSFTSIISNKLSEDIPAGFDETETFEMVQEIPSAKNILPEFPGGVLAGNFFHKIFELIDFPKVGGLELEEIVSKKLREYNFDNSYLNTVCVWIREALAFKLFALNDFSLNRLSNSDRLSELNFYFPVKDLSSSKLKKIFSMGSSPFKSNVKEMLSLLDFSQYDGYMNGSIDLVFRNNGKYFIVDWKTNKLGDSLNDFSIEKLRDVMVKNYYFLQMYIYSAALHKYLSTRLIGYDYERDFGGVFYYFIRGIAEIDGRQYGVFPHKPEFTIINELAGSITTSMQV